MSLYISGIPSDRINEVWEDCEPYIEMGNGKSRDEMSVEDIYKRLSEARMQLWLVFNEDREIISVLITEIIDYDNSDLDDEEKIDRLFNQKELIERRIQSLNLIIKKLADQILENQITEGDNNE